MTNPTRTLMESFANLISGQSPFALDALSFYTNDEEQLANEFPAFASGLEQPVPRWCCAIGWQSALKHANGASVPLSKQETMGHLYGGTGYSGVPVNVFNAQIANFVAWITDTAPEYYFEQGIPRQKVSEDPVGYVYTSRGGLIDIGHVRGLADRTRHLASLVLQHLPDGGEFQIYTEKGTRTIYLTQSISNPDPRLAGLIGARLAYETSVWHEIVTFFTWEQYSAFSPEDNYSNLLGCWVGFNSLFTDPKNDYNMAVNVSIDYALRVLQYQNKDVTIDSVDYVDDHFYLYNDAYDVTEMPGANFPDYSPWTITAPLRADVHLELLRRHFDSYGVVQPWLVTELELAGNSVLRDSLRSACGHPVVAAPIRVPNVDMDGNPLTDYYRMETYVSTDRIPASFLTGLPNPITTADFPTLIERLRAIHVDRYGPGTDRPETP
ncbi:hypothetical protein KOR42_54050 [Thalassoglobus neptunius]|uniref:Uncharacterized protein n=1 Tax=Thalassoglobus neptunius TaxID=1938619 RepID=A0A5C5UX44_9PLAN|nr:DUF4056 domain-containing protein [Thalassoglobus neptunius]TWT30954.1 hypothetical protein KOR42_54050 [Thalassoglobus neptunius]